MNQQHLDPHLLQTVGMPYSPLQTLQLLDELMQNIDWQYDYEAFGRRFTVPRLQAWYADDGVHYRYSDNMLISHPWTPMLLDIKNIVETNTAHKFNSVLVTYYRDGEDHVTWHADNEPELGDEPVIASLSFGASRQFLYRHNHTNETRAVVLNDGELLLMHPAFQQHWQHCVPPEPEIQLPRINLTFRNVVLTRNE